MKSDNDDNKRFKVEFNADITEESIKKEVVKETKEQTALKGRNVFVDVFDKQVTLKKERFDTGLCEKTSEAIVSDVPLKSLEYWWLSKFMVGFSFFL